MYIFYLFIFYMILNFIFLLPFAILIMFLKFGAESLFGASDIIEGATACAFVCVLLAELWLVHRCAHIMVTEKETMDGAIKAALIEAWSYILLMLPNRD